MTGRSLVGGRGAGPLLRLTHPLSLWGGVDPRRGTIVDPRHPQHGASITGRVLAMPSAVGSSSSSAIMLELIREGTAPAAVLLGRSDAILALGVIVAGELGYPRIPVTEISMEGLADFEEGAVLEVSDARVAPRPRDDSGPASDR